MDLISINKLSKKYEMIYKAFCSENEKSVAFAAVNNALIFIYFLRCLHLNYDETNFYECSEAIVKTYGNSVFFDFENEDVQKKTANATNELYKELLNTTIDNETLCSILGNILEKHINQKETGSYYTPDDTTYFIASHSIAASILSKCDENLGRKLLKAVQCDSSIEIVSKIDITIVPRIIKDNLDDDEIDNFIETMYDISIIDPTCGSGAFIIAAFNYIEDLIKALGRNPDYERILNSLFGVDIESEAVKLTQLRLLLKTADFVGGDIFNIIINRNFKVADALIGADYVIDEEGFDWKSFGKKFDCIIGNPPYVESKQYVSTSFKTRECGNLYAYAIERACNISHEDSVVSFIVPLPLVSTPRMQTAKKYLEFSSSEVYYCTFADRPGCIFSGVHQRLVIFFASISKKKPCKVFSSAYRFWYNEERSDLFKNLEFVENDSVGLLAKYGNEIEKKLYMKLVNNKDSFLDLLVKEGKYSLYMSTRIGFWTKAFLENVFSSKEYKKLNVGSERDKVLVTAILNSSIFYFHWIMVSDCWHVTNQNLSVLTFDMSLTELVNIQRLTTLVELLMEDLENHKKYVGSKQVEYEYKHKYSKKIIDEIDKELAVLFNLTDEEVSYIINYTQKYRLNNMEGKQEMNVIDLFSGVGGFSSGFRKAGYNIVLANEIESSIAESYKKNHPETIMLNDDIKNILPELEQYKGKIDVIIGGPPCQGFSMAGARIRSNKGTAFLDDPRNYLFRHYFAIVQELEPTFFVMENVPGMLSMSGGEIIQEIERLFTDDKNFRDGPYHIYKQILDASEYGVPQDRHRLIIFGTKKDIDIPLVFAEVKEEMIHKGEIKQTTIYDAISDLNWLESGEGAFQQLYRTDPETDYQRARRKNSNSLYNHKATTHSDVALRRMKELKPGGRRLDLAEGKDIKSVHSGAYGRMRWDDLSKTIITRFDTPSSGVYIHPERTRTITPREAARIQSFDDDFVFYGNKSSVIKQIGNAVPPLLAYYLARVIKKASEM